MSTTNAKPHHLETQARASDNEAKKCRIAQKSQDTDKEKIDAEQYSEDREKKKLKTAKRKPSF